MIARDEGRDRSGGQELATSTLAEIYAQQGLLERARAIYERIAQRTPDDPHVAERLDALTRAIRDRAGTPPPATAAVEARRETETARAPEARPAPATEPEPDEEFEAWLRRR